MKPDIHDNTLSEAVKWLMRSIVVAAGCVALAISPTGCRLGTNVPHDPPIFDTNHVVRTFAPGLIVTFPSEPSDGVVSLMKDAGARRESPFVFVIESYDRHNNWQGYALEQAYKEHATVTGWKP